MANLTDIKNIPVKLILSALALGSSNVISDFAEAGHKINVDRRSADGGKQIGRVRVGLTAGVPSMLIATGKDPVALWSDTINVDVTPAYTPAFPTPIVGVGTDIKPNFNTFTEETGLASVPFPIVPEADLVDLGHTVNYFEYSGKRKGTVVLTFVGIVLTYAIASGREPADTWRLADGTIITPVGTLRPATSTENSDFKPTVDNAEWLHSNDFPVLFAGDLLSLDYDPLYNDEQRVSSHNEHQVIAISGGLMHLMYGIRDAGVLTWHDLGGILSDIVVAASAPAGSIVTAGGTTSVPAVARVLTFCPSGTDVVLDITGNVSGLQQLAFTTTEDLTVVEMAAEVALQAQVFIDEIITSSGEDVLILATGVNVTITINVFTLT